MKKLKGNITSFVTAFFEHLVKNKRCDIPQSKKYANTIKSVDIIGEQFSLRFLPEWGGKKYYLTLYKGSNYCLELFLCRMLFDNDGKILWYLATPTRRINQTIYSSFFEKKEPIPRSTVSKIKKQQEALHGGSRKFNAVKNGYLIADKITPQTTFKKLERMIFAIINENTSEEEKNIAVIEGVRNEQKRLTRSRSRKYIEKVKARDEYTCQSCKLNLKINNKHILQIHHLRPLKEETTTKEKDLVCLCPTCHYIAHCKHPPFTPSEIAKLLKEN